MRFKTRKELIEWFSTDHTSSEFSMNVSQIAADKEKMIFVLEWISTFVLFSNKYDESDMVNMFLYVPVNGVVNDTNRTAIALTMNPFINLENFNNNTLLGLFQSDAELLKYKDVLLNQYVPQFYESISNYSINIGKILEYEVNQGDPMFPLIQSKFEKNAYREYCYHQITSGLSSLIIYLLIAIMKRKRYLIANYSTIAFKYNRDQIIKLLEESIKSTWDNENLDLLEYTTGKGYTKKLLTKEKGDASTEALLMVNLQSDKNSNPEYKDMSMEDYIEMVNNRIVHVANGMNRTIKIIENLKNIYTESEMTADTKKVYEVFKKNYASADDVFLAETIPKTFTPNDGFYDSMITLEETKNNFYNFAAIKNKDAVARVLSDEQRTLDPFEKLSALFAMNMEDIGKLIYTSLFNGFNTIKELSINNLPLIVVSTTLAVSISIYSKKNKKIVLNEEDVKLLKNFVNQSSEDNTIQ